MFAGNYQHTLDDKGRIVLPARFRKELKEGLVITPWPGPCLLLIPKLNWQSWRERLASLPKTDKKVQDFLRVFYFHMAEETPDRQGRISLTESQRAWIQVKKELVIIGMGEWLEVWSKENWQQHYEEILPNYGDYCEGIAL